MAEDAARTTKGDGVVLTPDPTELTREALVREIDAVRQTLEAVIGGKVEVIATRLAGMDQAVTLVREMADRLPAQMDSKIGHLEKLHNERFNGVSLQFAERDTRVKDAKAAGDDALKAALAAQKEQAGDQVKSLKESIDKSEAATTKQIDTQGASINTATQGLERQIGDLKERLTRVEAGMLGRSAQVVEQRAVVADTRQGQGAQLAIFAAVMLVVSTIIALGSLALVAAR